MICTSEEAMTLCFMVHIPIHHINIPTTVMLVGFPRWRHQSVDKSSCTMAVNCRQVTEPQPTVTHTEISIIKYRHMGSLKYASRQTYIEIKCSTLQAPGSRLTRPPSVLHSIRLLAAYRRVYDSHHLQADCKEPGSAPEPYAQ